MRRLLIVAIIVLNMSVAAAQCGGESEPTCEPPTPTATETPTATYTPSSTPTPTPGIVQYGTLVPPGSETGFGYTLVFQVDAGQAATVILLFWISSLLTVDFIARHREEKP